MTASERGDARDLIALYVAGALSDEERLRVEAWLPEADEATREYFLQLSSLATELAQSPESVEPDRSVRERILERIRPKSVSMDDVYVSRDRDAEWKPLPVPGLSMRWLYRGNDRLSGDYLVRLESGSEIPPHFHPMAETCLVLQGEVEMLENVFGPGDYVRFSPNTTHPLTRARGECLLLFSWVKDS